MSDPVSPLSITIDHARAIPWPSHTTHKHGRGRLAVIAGGPLQTGAARLAARAGQRVGAGWVSLIGARAACEVMAHHETSILIDERDDHIAFTDQVQRFDAVVIGPAFGLSLSASIDVAMLINRYRGALILDADALTHISADRETLFHSLKNRPLPAILTPHAGEFAMLFGAFEPQDKAAATIEAARQSGCIVVHKGATTFLASPDGALFATDEASPFLATAGTGDVLAGMIGGLCAQGMRGMEACKAALWIHGEASRRIRAGLIAEDLICALPPILNALTDTVRET